MENPNIVHDMEGFDFAFRDIIKEIYFTSFPVINSRKKIIRYKPLPEKPVNKPKPIKRVNK